MAGEDCKLRDWTMTGYNAFKVTVAGSAVSKGDTVVTENQVGFYMEDGAVGDEVGVCVEARKAIFPKTSGVAITMGDDVYWNDVTNEVCLTSTYRPVGYAIMDAASAATTVWIRFKQEPAGSTY